MSAFTRAIVRAFQQNVCSEGVIRSGMYEPCDLPAIAIRLDPEEEEPYPVCKKHTRGMMVAMSVIILALEVEGVPESNPTKM